MQKKHCKEQPRLFLTGTIIIFILILYAFFAVTVSGCSPKVGDMSAPGSIEPVQAQEPQPIAQTPPENPTPQTPQAPPILKYAYASAKDGGGIDMYEVNYTTGIFSWIKKMPLTQPYKMCFSHKKRDGTNPQYLYAASATAVKRFNLTDLKIDDTWAGIAGTRLQDIEITSNPEDKYVYALETNNSTVICTDVDTLPPPTVINMDAGSQLSSIALTPDGSRLVLADGGFGPDAPYFDKYHIPVIKTSNNSFDYTKKTSWGKPVDLAIDPTGAYAYILSADENRLLILDIASQDINYINLSCRPTGIAITPDGQNAYITSFSNDKVMIVALHGLSGTIELAAKIDVKAGPRYPGISSDGKYLWVPCYTDNKICVVKIDNNANTTEKIFTTSTGPWHILAE